MGLVGALVVIVLFVLLVKRAFDIAMRTKDTFASLLVMGIAVQVGLQAALNIAVVTDLIPNTGISLPFTSCSLQAFSIAIASAVVWNVTTNLNSFFLMVQSQFQIQSPFLSP